MPKNTNTFPIFHIDTFTNQIFKGNPAAVCVLTEWLPDEIMHAVARENNQSSTAFLIPDAEQYQIRWITPEYELEICGHGSLAAGFVIFKFLAPNTKKINLQSKHEILQVTLDKELITLDFPVKNIEACSIPGLEDALGAKPKETYKHKNERCLAVLSSEAEVRKLEPNIEKLKKIPFRGITITAPGTQSDIVSRTFYPHKTIWEDPATGASHCLLAPYWANHLNKKALHAFQISPRGGEIFCKLEEDRVKISGKAAIYMKGIISV